MNVKDGREKELIWSEMDYNDEAVKLMLMNSNSMKILYYFNCVHSWLDVEFVS